MIHAIYVITFITVWLLDSRLDRKYLQCASIQLRAIESSGFRPADLPKYRGLYSIRELLSVALGHTNHHAVRPNPFHEQVADNHHLLDVSLAPSIADLRASAVKSRSNLRPHSTTQSPDLRHLRRKPSSLLLSLATLSNSF